MNQLSNDHTTCDELCLFRTLQAMQEHAAVFRDGPTLQEGCRKISELWKEQFDLKVNDLANQL